MLVAERERGGPYPGAGELAARSGVSRDTLERLAWAGACEAARWRAVPASATRRDSLWQIGVVGPGRAGAGRSAARAAARGSGGAARCAS